ncbi:hypothetical protein C8Q77DRAFT_1126856 [Trametes polyzona]|nr:hypothetical protein C8Q77DRAFT_1126856 [Trametes polyzona]
MRFAFCSFFVFILVLLVSLPSTEAAPVNNAALDADVRTGLEWLIRRKHLLVTLNLRFSVYEWFAHETPTERR